MALAVQNLRVQDNKNTFAFGYADLGKLDCQTQEAIATASVHLVFSSLISIITLDPLSIQICYEMIDTSMEPYYPRSIVY